MSTKNHCDICDEVMQDSTDVDFAISKLLDGAFKPLVLRGTLKAESNGKVVSICDKCLEKNFLKGNPTYEFPLISLRKSLRGEKPTLASRPATMQGSEKGQ